MKTFQCQDRARRNPLTSHAAPISLSSAAAEQAMRNSLQCYINPLRRDLPALLAP